jgi:hypothetical protein
VPERETEIAAVAASLGFGGETAKCLCYRAKNKNCETNPMIEQFQ